MMLSATPAGGCDCFFCDPAMAAAVAVENSGLCSRAVVATADAAEAAVKRGRGGGMRRRRSEAREAINGSCQEAGSVWVEMRGSS